MSTLIPLLSVNLQGTSFLIHPGLPIFYDLLLRLGCVLSKITSFDRLLLYPISHLKESVLNRVVFIPLSTRPTISSLTEFVLYRLVLGPLVTLDPKNFCEKLFR